MTEDRELPPIALAGLRAKLARLFGRQTKPEPIEPIEHSEAEETGFVVLDQPVPRRFKGDDE